MNRRRVNVYEPLQVTGGSGFVGSHLVDQLMRDGHEVSVAIYSLGTWLLIGASLNDPHTECSLWKFLHICTYVSTQVVCINVQALT